MGQADRKAAPAWVWAISTLACIEKYRVQYLLGAGVGRQASSQPASTTPTKGARKGPKEAAACEKTEQDRTGTPSYRSYQRAPEGQLEELWCKQLSQHAPATRKSPSHDPLPTRVRSRRLDGAQA